MSEQSIRRLVEHFEPRADAIDRIAVPDRLDAGVQLLREFFTALVRDLAESIFLRAHTTPGMTQERAQELVDEAMLQHGLIITETVHNIGGTLDMVFSLTDSAHEAYAARLAELSFGQARGGVA